MSKFRQEQYTWPRMVLDIDDFSNPGSLPSMTLLDHRSYYTRQPGIMVGQTLDAPATFVELIDTFIGLPREDKERFLRSSYWFQHSHDVFSLSKSAAFMALVSAVESLIPGWRSPPRCEKCGQSLGPGPTQLFADFVDLHLPGAQIPQTERKRFYRLRSALSHGGMLLLHDVDMWRFTPTGLSEDTDMRVLWRIVHIVLHNWLAKRGGPGRQS